MESSNHGSTRPNIVLIFTDNQQAATLGCYGNHEVHTPNLDKLAANGMLFDNAFGANAYCSPTRASVLTGEIPSAHGVHTWIDDRNMHEWPAGWHALAQSKTLPQELQKLGYRTGMFGKYHLGDPKSTAPGWNSWVTMADGHVRSFYNNAIFDNGETYAQPGHSVDFFTDKTIEFIQQHKKEHSDNPYFAYVPLPAPYGHWPATNDGNRNRFAELYDECPMQTVPRASIRASAVANYDRIKSQSGQGLDFSMLMRAPNHLPTLRNYYSQITMIDEAVGRIVETDPDALIIFTTDHGLSLGQHGFWGHGGSTYPSNLHYAAHSIPLIVSQPGIVQAGATSSLHLSNTDLYATILDCAGGSANPELPSRSFAPVLKGATPENWGDDEMYAEQEETRVIRTPDWVMFKRFIKDGVSDLQHELYDVNADPDETNNLAQSPDHAAVVAELSKKIDDYFEQYAKTKADMWKGGVPIQNSTLIEYWRGIWGQQWQPVYYYE
jgi:arylsulfatase A-like enzyme